MKSICLAARSVRATATIAAAAALVFAVAACSDSETETDKQRPVQTTVSASPIAQPTSDEGDVLLAGVGLRGLRLLPPSQRLSDDEAAALTEMVYPEMASGEFFIKREGKPSLNARPYMAFRSGERTVLVTAHDADGGCRLCPGLISFHYFNKEGSKLEKSFPLAKENGGWGEAGEARLTRLPNGEVVMMTLTGLMAQGFTIYDLDFTSFGDSGPAMLASFPYQDKNDNEGILGPPMDVLLAGAEISPDGKSLKLRYTGEKWDEAGNSRKVQEERIVTLDGLDDAWVEAWEYRERGT